MALHKFIFTSILFFIVISILPPPAEGNPFLTPGTSESQTETHLLPRHKTTPLHPALRIRQAYVSRQLGEFLYALGDTPSPLQIASVLATAFLYGILHALGPGHRKAILFSLYVSRRAPAWEPAFAGIGIAFLHGTTSIGVYLLFHKVSGLLSGIAETVTFYMEALTYLLLIGVGIGLLIHTLRDLQACSHNAPSPSLSFSALLLSGLYPCPGAFLILLLAGTLNRIDLGILAVASMSGGSGLILISFAYLGWFGRETLIKRYLNSHSSFERFPAYLQIGGYILLILFSVYLAVPYLQVLLYFM